MEIWVGVGVKCMLQKQARKKLDKKMKRKRRK